MYDPENSIMALCVDYLTSSVSYSLDAWWFKFLVLLLKSHSHIIVADSFFASNIVLHLVFHHCPQWTKADLSEAIDEVRSGVMVIWCDSLLKTA